MSRRTRLANALLASKPQFHFIPDATSVVGDTELVYRGSVLLGSLKTKPGSKDAYYATTPGATLGWVEFPTKKKALQYLLEVYKPNGTAQYSVNW